MIRQCTVPLSYYFLQLFVLLLLRNNNTKDRNTSTFVHANSIYPSTPVIGVLSQPHHNKLTNQTEYIIASSYIKWLEAGGARAIPIPYDSSDDLIDDILLQVNGILFPGGSSEVPPSAWRIWRNALEMNHQGDVFPIWGTCLGYEYLILMTAAGPGQDQDNSGGVVVLESGYDAENISWPLQIDGNTFLAMNSSKSHLYSTLQVRTIATTVDVGMNNHKMGVQPSVFASNIHLSTMFRVTSTNIDRQNKSFVSSIESDLYPFYGVQYHPEKNPFEYATHHGTDIPYENINHSPEAIQLSFHLANFFVNLTRQNQHVHTKPIQYPPVSTYEVKTSLAFQEYFVIPSVASLVEEAIAEAEEEKSSPDEEETH